MFPSIKTNLGLFLSFLIALFIANKLAFKMFNFSISIIDAEPIAQKEFSLIYFSKISRLIFESFLESLSFFIFILLFNITAAAKTGPIKLPLPTSSTPAMSFFI